MILHISRGNAFIPGAPRIRLRSDILDNETLYQTISRRRSIRKYLDEPLDRKTLEAVDSEIASLKPLFPGIKTEIRRLGSGDTKGMFKVSAPHYLAIYSENKPGYAANAGFLLQQMDLFFSSQGIGACWQGGSKPGGKIAPVAELEFVIILAFGKAAETLQRAEVSEFKRKPLTDITDAKDMDDLLEPVRLAPSGVNNQSWYYHAEGSRIDAFSAKSLVTDEMNQINVGIGLCHLWLSALHQKRGVDFTAESGGVQVPKGYRYIATARLK
jgi:nitroreductase